jgi:Leucine-rich repeat (LRR) protein
MTSLSELSLANTYPPEGDSLDLGPLAGLPNLKRLNLSGSYVPSLDSLVGLTTLEVLDLRDSLTPGTEFPKFASLRQLKDLRLGDSPYEDESIPIANLRFLRALPQLETLDLKCRYIDGNLGAELARAKSLRKLSVCYLSDFGPLSALTGLQELTVLDAPEDLRPLSKLRALRLLHLSGSATKPARVANLAQLSQLEELTLRFRGVQPLAEVATLPRLHRLTLSLGPNDSLAPLASLPELELLNITNNVVRQVDLLAQIRSLKKLVHHHTTIPPEELLHLREQRPDLIFEPPLASDDP